LAYTIKQINTEILVQDKLRSLRDLEITAYRKRCKTIYIDRMSEERWLKIIWDLNLHGEDEDEDEDEGTGKIEPRSEKALHLQWRRDVVIHQISICRQSRVCQWR
jgi:hypothetical protein